MSVEMEYMIRRVGVLVDGADGGLLDVVAMEVERKARANAMAKGGRRFWVSEIVNSLHTETVGDSRVVGSTHVAAAQKQYGGPIEAPGKGEGARGAKALTIPLGIARENRWDVDKAQAAGYEIYRAKTRDGRGFLFGRRTRGQGNRSRHKDELLFALRKRVVQKPDKWFPEGAELEQVVNGGIELFLSTHGGVL